MSDFGESISSLPLLPSVTGPVFLPVVANGTTYKILLYPVTNDRIASGAVTGNSIAASTVTGNNIVPYTITANLLDPSVLNSFTVGPGSINTAELANGAVTTPILAAGAVTGTIIAAGAVGTANLAASAVTTPIIADGAVTTAKLATGAVTAANLAANSVGTAAIQASAVGTTQIADGAITDPKLAPSFYTTLAATLVADPSFINEIVAAAPFEGLTSLNTLYGAVTIGATPGSGLTFTNPTTSSISINSQAAPIAISCYVNSTGSDLTPKFIVSGAVTMPFATIQGALTWFENNVVAKCAIAIKVQTNISEGPINCRYFSSIVITNDPNAPSFFPVVTLTQSGSVNYLINCATNVRIEAVDFVMTTWNVGNTLIVVPQGGVLQHGASSVSVSGSYQFLDFWSVAGQLILANTNLTARTYSVNISATVNGTNLFDVLPDGRMVLGDTTGLTSNTNQYCQLATTLTVTTFLNLQRGAEFILDSSFAINHTISATNVVGIRAAMDMFSRVVNTGALSGSNAQMLGGNVGTLFTYVTPVLIPSAIQTLWTGTTALLTY